MKERIRELMQAAPFRPFIIRTEDGREFRIDHPDFILASSQPTTQVVIERPDGRMHFVAERVIANVELAVPADWAPGDLYP